jgi:geranylgeranyl pyrophosphate synthase
MFTKRIYKTVLKNKIKEIDKKLLQIVQSPSIPTKFHPMLIEATEHGRRFRPLLLLVTNNGVGGKWRGVIELACAIELLHKASLIHDDVIDGDSFRRGKPTFWQTYGKRQAIIVGDLMIGLSFKTVTQWCSRNNHRQVNPIFEIFTTALNETSIGEIFDIQFESLPDVDYADIEKMTYLKSGSLISASMRIGALTGGASANTVETLTRLGNQIGIIFQIINDKNSITGRDVPSKGTYCNDVIQKKKTFATNILRQAGISEKELNKITEPRFTEVLQLIKSEIDKRIKTAAECIENLPGGFMKELYSNLLKEAQEDWFWINVNE